MPSGFAGVLALLQGPAPSRGVLIGPADTLSVPRGPVSSCGGYDPSRGALKPDRKSTLAIGAQGVLGDRLGFGGKIYVGPR